MLSLSQLSLLLHYMLLSLSQPSFLFLLHLSPHPCTAKGGIFTKKKLYTNLRCVFDNLIKEVEVANGDMTTGEPRCWPVGDGPAHRVWKLRKKNFFFFNLIWTLCIVPYINIFFICIGTPTSKISWVRSAPNLGMHYLAGWHAHPAQPMAQHNPSMKQAPPIPLKSCLESLKRI